jgi:hypothetical protein
MQLQQAEEARRVKVQQPTGMVEHSSSMTLDEL